MSCYNWEEGTVKFPASEWAAFRTAIINKVNEEREKQFKLAEEAYDAIKAHAKGKRGFDRYRYAHGHQRFYDVARFITKREEPGKLFRPKKKCFPKLPTSKSVVLHLGEATITLDNKKRALTYSSGENNRAVEHARDIPTVAFMFRLLGRVKFTARTGGQFIGNDEYNRDARYEGGGGNYVTETYPRPARPTFGRTW